MGDLIFVVNTQESHAPLLTNEYLHNSGIELRHKAKQHDALTVAAAVNRKGTYQA